MKVYLIEMRGEGEGPGAAARLFWKTHKAGEGEVYGAFVKRGAAVAALKGLEAAHPQCKGRLRVVGFQEARGRGVKRKRGKIEPRRRGGTEKSEERTGESWIGSQDERD